MKCDICKVNEAEIHIQQGVGEVVNNLHICKACAEERGIDASNPSINNILTGIFSQLFKDKGKMNKDFEESVVCPVCRLSLKDFKDKELVGCSNCYSFFEKELSSYNLFYYNGRVPEKYKVYKDFLIDLPNLESELEEALDNEDYELATLKKEEIERIKNGK